MQIADLHDKQANIERMNKPSLSLSASMLAIALLGALVFNGPNAYQFSLNWLVLIVLAGYLLSQHKSIAISFDALTLSSIAFVGWMFVSLFWHPVPWQGLNYSWRLSEFFFVLLLVRYLAQQHDLRAMFIALLSVGVLVALFSLYQSYVLQQPASGLFVNKNNNAAFLNLFLLPVMSLLLFKDDKWPKVLLNSVILVVLLLAVLEVSSRGAFIGLGIASALLFTFAFKHKCARGLLLVLSIIAITILAHYFFSTVELRKDIESASRWHIWASTLQMLSDYGWRGVGNGMFSILYPMYRNPGDVSAGYFVHNDFLQVLLELGAPGLLLLLIVLATISNYSIKLIQFSPRTEESGIYFGLFCALIAVSIHSLVTFNYYKVGILLIMGAYSGILVRKSLSITQNTSYEFTTTVSKYLPVVFVVIMLASASSLFRIGYASAVTEGLVGSALNTGTPSQKYQLLGKLNTIDTDNYVYPYMMAKVLCFSEKNNIMMPEPARYHKCRQLLNEAKAYNRYAYLTYLLEAKLLYRFQDQAGPDWRRNSVKTALTALSLVPTQSNVRVEVAKHLVRLGKGESALGLVLKGVSESTRCDMGYYKYGKRLASSLNNKVAVNIFSGLIEREKVLARQDQEEWLKEIRPELNK